ncbi:MAG: thiamine pyrophosphate-binding protein [Chloroflexi bacterium]|nr:thiamine pyrophosphate-binding protein [Chloroflexota bacterium]
MTRKGAQALVRAMQAANVSHLFSLSGNQIMSVYDALIGSGIRVIHTRHEAAAVHMADAWGRLTDQPGVVLLTAGPGHLNSVSALYAAHMAESPLVALSGHSALAQAGRGAFQEVDQVAVVAPVCKAAWRVDNPAALAGDFARAMEIAASGRPGPVHLSLPVDVLEAVVPALQPPAVKLAPHPTDDTQLAGMLDALLGAVRPLIVAGPAMSRGVRWRDVMRLSDVTGVPALACESPRGMNDPWLHGAAALMAEADVVLLLGKPLDFSLKWGKPPAFNGKFMQIDPDAGHLRQAAVPLSVAMDPQWAVERLSALAESRASFHHEWLIAVETARLSTLDEWALWRESDARPIHPLRLCAAVQPHLDAGAILIADGGEFGQWAQGGLEATTRLINGPAGGIGAAVPMAIGAKLADSSRTVFAISGDGAFGYHLAEFETAVRNRIPFVAIVGNDARWNAEHQIQIQTYGADRTFGCELMLARYDRVVAALGGFGAYVEDPADLAAAIAQAVHSGLPSCVNLAIDGLPAPFPHA